MGIPAKPVQAFPTKPRLKRASAEEEGNVEGEPPTPELGEQVALKPPEEEFPTWDDDWPPPPAPVKAPQKTLPPCETYGTSIEFARNPSEGARRASQERKLMFVLHLSGNFEDSKFT